MSSIDLVTLKFSFPTTLTNSSNPGQFYFFCCCVRWDLVGSAHSALLVFVFCLGFLFGFGQRGIRRREGRFSLLHAVFIDRNSLLKKVKKNGFDPPYPVFFSKVPGCPAEFLCPTVTAGLRDNSIRRGVN